MPRKLKRNSRSARRRCSRLADAAQVGQGNEGDHADAKGRPVSRQPGEVRALGSRGDRLHPGSDGDRHRQDVVHQQGRGGSQPCGGAEVLLGDDVRPAAEG